MLRRTIPLLFLGLACTAAPTDDPSFDGEKADRPSNLPLSVPSIDSAATFREISFADGGLLVMGRSVKFLIDHRDPSKPVVHFVNANFPNGGDATRFHWSFARAVLHIQDDVATFNARTYFTQDKDFYAGTLQEYRLGDDRHAVYGIQLYPQDVAREETLVPMLRALSAKVKIAGAELAFVATGPQQTSAKIGAALRELKIAPLSIDAILGQTRYLPMQLGECWGHLRMFPGPDALLAPTDIPVFDELPLDLTVVAGVITRAVQDSSSHINLKSKERGTPDFVLRDASPGHPDLAKWIGKPIHLVVRSDGFTITASTDAEVARKLDERRSRPWIPVVVERDTRVLPYAEMCPRDPAGCLALARRYGSKAANLGFLTSPRVLGRAADAGSKSAGLGYDLVPGGAGVPLAFYQDFVAANPSLGQAIDALVADEKSDKLDAAARKTRLEAVQAMFMRAAFPAGMLETLTRDVSAVMPAGVTKMKVRSSANAEDIPNFDGAGLYTSFSADLAAKDAADGSCIVRVDSDDGDLEVKPKTLACAVRGVYASLWNQRAIEERSFARLDHATAAMGLAIVPKYDFESNIVANSVVVTRTLNGSVMGYTFSTQLGNTLVTNPPPGTAAEQIIVAFSPDAPTAFTPTRFAVPEAGAAALTSPILSSDQLELYLDLTSAIETAYCEARPAYYDGDCRDVTWDPEKKRALDLEIKVLETGRLVFKQVREFSGE